MSSSEKVVLYDQRRKTDRSAGCTKSKGANYRQWDFAPSSKWVSDFSQPTKNKSPGQSESPKNKKKKKKGGNLNLNCNLSIKKITKTFVAVTKT